MRFDFIGAPPSQMFDDEGYYTDEYFAYCITVLRRVCDFGDSSLPTSTSCTQDFFCSIEDAVEIRQVFAFAPKALEAVNATFRQARCEDGEWARKRLRANTKPLAPLIAEIEAKKEARANVAR